MKTGQIDPRGFETSSSIACLAGLQPCLRRHAHGGSPNNDRDRQKLGFLGYFYFIKHFLYDSLNLQYSP